MKSYASLRRKVWAFYRTQGRHHLPWRKTRNVYRILISEVMLQQTQVTRVLPAWRAWVRVLPNWSALARVPTPRLMALWQGLGYNRRAFHLKRLAQVVVQQHNGRLPHGLPELLALPGVGPYTARAVAVLAFQKPQALVETNIRKVILHEYFPRRRRVPEREVLAVAERLLDRRRPRAWNLALMDYGAAYFQGRILNPNRRSAGYAKQGQFRGSKRQVRGVVVRRLVRGRASVAQLAAYLRQAGLSSAQLRQLPQVVRQLAEEGLVERVGSAYRLAS